MKVEAGKVITLEYKITTEQGELIESSAGRGKPLVFVHGEGGGLLPGVDSRLEGLEEGESTQFTLPPVEAFGEIETGPTMPIGKGFLPEQGQLTVGAMFEGELPGTNQTVKFVILEDQGANVIVRLIHPLAGKTINVEASVLKVENPS